jgi:hypothetical protein
LIEPKAFSSAIANPFILSTLHHPKFIIIIEKRSTFKHDVIIYEVADLPRAAPVS